MTEYVPSYLFEYSKDSIFSIVQLSCYYQWANRANDSGSWEVTYSIKTPDQGQAPEAGQEASAQKPDKATGAGQALAGAPAGEPEHGEDGGDNGPDDGQEATTEQTDHDKLSFTGCYDDYCPVHRSDKEGALYFPKDHSQPPESRRRHRTRRREPVVEPVAEPVVYW